MNLGHNTYDASSFVNLTVPRVSGLTVQNALRSKTAKGIAT